MNAPTARARVAATVALRHGVLLAPLIALTRLFPSLRKLSTMKLTPALLTLFFGAHAVVAGLKPAPKILLSRVDFLTLRNGQMTKSRRVEPIPQVPIYLPISLHISTSGVTLPEEDG